MGSSWGLPDNCPPRDMDYGYGLRVTAHGLCGSVVDVGSGVSASTGAALAVVEVVAFVAVIVVVVVVATGATDETVTC